MINCDNIPRSTMTMKLAVDTPIGKTSTSDVSTIRLIGKISNTKGRKQ